MFTFLSITAPGAGILPLDKQPRFCRQANKYAAKIRNDCPSRYGFFASIPSLLEPVAAHEEIIYALDNLQADGVTLYSRYGEDNHYLGHPDFQATWDLLDNRGAVVFVHPTHPVDTSLVNPSLPQPMIDYPHETTRTAVDLITSGTIRSHPNVKIILSHAGGTLPYIAPRPAAMLPYIPPAASEATVNEDAGNRTSITLTENFLEDARSFYFDTALSAAPLTLSLLKGFAKPGRVLYGSDFPYAPAPAIRQMNHMVDKFSESNGPSICSAEFVAALDLFPRLHRVFGFQASEASA